MIALPWGEQKLRENLTMLNQASQSQRLLVAHIPEDSRWPIDVSLRADFIARAEWLESMAMDLIQALANLEREDDLEREDSGDPDRQAVPDEDRDPGGVDA